MTEKTTEEVVVSEMANGQQTGNKSRRKPAARKAATTKKKAAKMEDAVEPAIEVNDNVAPAKRQPQRRGRKPKQKAVEAAQTITENNEASVLPNTNTQQPTSDTQHPQDAVVEVETPVAEVPTNEGVKDNDESVKGKEESVKNEGVKGSEESVKNEGVKSNEEAEETANIQHPSPNTQATNTQKPNTQKTIPPFNPVRIDTIVDMVNAPKGQLLLNDQQIQQLTQEEALKRFRWIEGTLAWVLNYDVVISDTNIWLELLVGHTSSHSDPKVNARLMFERQLEFISKLVRYRGGRFMMMSETYEEIDRFATQQAPTNYKDADFTDEALCRNVSARLAKRLILSQLRENRLKIEGICAESHHAAFADPAIIRKTVELFSIGKRVLLLTNDASVAIRGMGMCDDLQRINEIDDETWERVYAPLRPMVITMDDLKVLDLYTRQYHFLQMAAGKQWMEDVPQRMEKRNIPPLSLWLDGFRPGDKQSEMHKQQKQSQAKQEKQNKQKQQNQAKQEQPKAQEQAEQPKQQKQQQPKPKNEPKQPQAEPKPEVAPSDLVIVTDIPDSQELPASPAVDSQKPQAEPIVEQQPKQQRKRPQRRYPQRKRPQQES